MKKKKPFPYFDKNIVCPRQSFIAYFFYIRKEKALNIVLRNGKQYRFDNVSVKLMNEVMTSQNRSSYIANNIVHSKKFQSEFIGVVPAADVEKVLQPANLTRWLAQ